MLLFFLVALTASIVGAICSPRFVPARSRRYKKVKGDERNILFKDIPLFCVGTSWGGSTRLSRSI